MPLKSVDIERAEDSTRAITAASHNDRRYVGGAKVAIERPSPRDVVSGEITTARKHIFVHNDPVASLEHGNTGAEPGLIDWTRGRTNGYGIAWPQPRRQDRRGFPLRLAHCVCS